MQNDRIEKGQKLHNILFLPYLRVTWRQFPKLKYLYFNEGMNEGM